MEFWLALPLFRVLQRNWRPSPFTVPFLITGLVDVWCASDYVGLKDSRSHYRKCFYVNLKWPSRIPEGVCLQFRIKTSFPFVSRDPRQLRKCSGWLFWVLEKENTSFCSPVASVDICCPAGRAPPPVLTWRQPSLLSAQGWVDGLDNVPHNLNNFRGPPTHTHTQSFRNPTHSLKQHTHSLTHMHTHSVKSNSMCNLIITH